MGSQGRPRSEASAGRISADYITDELSPTAARILAAAQRVLQRDGYAGVTLQRVAAEAGEHKSLVLYHFGNKASLMTMLVDSLWHDLDVELFHSLETLPEHSGMRIGALIDSQRRLGHLTAQQQMYLELFPGLTRHRDSRQHMGDLNRSYRDLHRRFLSATSLDADELAALAGLVLAVGDGMAVSLLIRPGDLDDLSAYRLLEDMVLSLSDVTRPGAGDPLPVAETTATWAQPRTANGGGVPGPDPLRDLSPVARKLVRGARTVLRKRGFEALTLESVGREADEPRSSITYYFGDKQGLISAMIEAQLYAQRRIAARILGAPGNGCGCTVAAACAARELLTDMTSFRVFFDILPIAIREPGFLTMQADHDRWLADLIASGLRAADDLALAQHADTLAVLEMAAADGLAMQVLSDPSGFDPRPSCAMLERLISSLAPGARETAGSCDGGA